MFDRTINIDMKQEWQTHYPPQLVGRYLKELYKDFRPEDLKLKPGQKIPMPEPDLNGYLRWFAREYPSQKDTLNE